MNTMKARILVLLVLLTSSVYGQTVNERIVTKACEYLSSVDSYQMLQDSLQKSITKAMADAMTDASPEEMNQFTTVEGVRGTFKAVFEMLPQQCYNVRRLIIEDKKNRFYKRSGIKLANTHYDKGNRLLESGDYRKAITEFESAIEADSLFVYAIDHLAISYRRLEDYKTAIEYYNKSLEIFPEGDLALLNIAVAYSYINDYANSIRSYEQLKYFYPKDPEGYFGLAKMLFLTGDYENALDNLFIAYRIYSDTGSPYKSDAEQLVSIINAKLTELNKLDLLEKKAKEHNIQITM